MGSSTTHRATLHALLMGGALAVSGCAKGIDPPAPTPVKRIEGGSFTMGFSDVDGCGLYVTTNQRPELKTEPRLESARITHRVSVETFCIDETEVTVSQYRHCFARGECGFPQATNAGNPGDDGFVSDYYGDEDQFGQHPVLGITHEEAVAYCAFRGGFLPTEAQWEYVASSRGARATVWSDRALDEVIAEGCDNGDFENTVALGSCSNGVRAVGTSSADVTDDGVFDMAGNAAEWVADDFDYLAYCASEQPGGRLESLFMVDDRRPLPIEANIALISSAAGDALTIADGQYAGGCNDAFDTCIDRCGVAFGNSDSPGAQQSKWQRYECGATVGLSTADVDQLPAVDDMACDADCQTVYACLSEPPVAPERGPACLVDCHRAADGCLADATVEGTAMTCPQFENNRNCVPTPWCVPRSDFAAESSHVRLDALTSDRIEDAKVVRGGHFQMDQTCKSLPAWRDFGSIGSPVIGFRCAYPSGSERCPAGG